MSAGLASPANMQLIRPIRALLTQIGREPININNDVYYKALKSRQEAYTKIKDTHKDSTLFSVGSKEVIQIEDRGPNMHGMITEGSSKDHWRWSYKVQVTKRGRVVMQKIRHTRHTPVTVEQYL